jgi:hypothetical protein
MSKVERLVRLTAIFGREDLPFTRRVLLTWTDGFLRQDRSSQVGALVYLRRTHTAKPTERPRLGPAAHRSRGHECCAACWSLTGFWEAAAGVSAGTPLTGGEVGPVHQGSMTPAPPRRRALRCSVPLCDVSGAGVRRDGLLGRHGTPTWLPTSVCGGVFGGRFKTPSTSIEALTGVSAGQGFLPVGVAGFEPTTSSSRTLGTAANPGQYGQVVGGQVHVGSVIGGIVAVRAAVWVGLGSAVCSTLCAAHGDLDGAPPCTSRAPDLSATRWRLVERRLPRRHSYQRLRNGPGVTHRSRPLAGWISLQGPHAHLDHSTHLPQRFDRRPTRRSGSRSLVLDLTSVSYAAVPGYWLTSRRTTSSACSSGPRSTVLPSSMAAYYGRIVPLAFSLF